ncbi:hypothetical protein MBLNU459_g3550t1 [Dothideomycetes sp. NU459]
MDAAALSPSSHDDPAALPTLAKGAPTAPANAPANALTPPTSEDMDAKMDDGSSDLSELSDIENDDDDDDAEEIVPDHYYDGGKIPVFKPTMDQFRSFKKFIDKIDKYGMKSGIVKVVPPPEWRNSLPDLDELVKTIKIKNPIMQEFMGTHGTYTQANIEKQRSYNLPEWKALTEESSNQPPARRGERRRNQEKVVRGGGNTRSRAAARTPAPKPDAGTGPVKRGRGRPRKNPLSRPEKGSEEETEPTAHVPPTPTSPARESVENAENPTPSKPKAKPRGRPPKNGQAKSVSSRRMNNVTEKSDVVDEAAFKDFDYRMHDLDYFTPERCAELETAYWKSLTFAQPMYAADMPGSLFDDSCESWNVAKLENLLDILGTKVPGVNTAYLYMGMWKATFAWHLEDVDLYSINYIHFGAPKQWYSISQEDARKFETAMKKIWPNDSKNCDQFLRHKTYLISPELLQKQYGIKVNKLVHNEGEFVITYPYGYHSGYNLGYNCAESVNFATEAWLDYGRIARKCDCEADSVWVDVADIERKLRGEPTPEYYEETDDDGEDDELEAETGDLPSPPASVAGKPKAQPRKRKRDPKEKDVGKKKKKRVRIRIGAPAKEPCVLCPNDVAYEPLLPTDNGRLAHRSCALYTPETWVSVEDGIEKVNGVTTIDRARLELKCNFCRSKRGACFQCASKKCTRAFHATCAVPAGVQVDAGMVPTFGEDGTEYFEEGFDFRCRFHRPRRAKNFDYELLESSKLVNNYAKTLKPKDVIQVQYPQGDVFGAMVVENRPSELSVLVNVLPDGDRIEVEWKWIAVLDPHDSLRPKPSASAIPMPEGMNKKSVSIENRQDGVPSVDEPFTENSGNKWAEFVSLGMPPSGFATTGIIKNKDQVKVNLDKPEQVYYYLPELSTEAKSKFSDDPTSRTPVAKADFIERVRPAPAARPIAASYGNPYNTLAANARSSSADRPYVYKPKVPPSRQPGSYSIDQRALASQRQFAQDAGRQVSYSNISPYGVPPAPQHQASDPSRHPTAPLRPFPGDAYYSSRVLPAAIPGEYSTFSEQPFPAIQHQNGAATAAAASPLTADPGTGMESLVRHADGNGPTGGMNKLETGFRLKDEPSVTKTLPQLPAPATAGISDVARRRSIEWTPPSHQYHVFDRAQSPPYQTPPQNVARPQPTYQSAQDFQQQIAMQSQIPNVANRYGAYDRMIRDMTTLNNQPPPNTFSSAPYPRGYATPQHTGYAQQSPKAPTPSPLSDTQTPRAARARSPASGSWGAPNHGTQAAPMASMMQGGPYTLPASQTQKS